MQPAGEQRPDDEFNWVAFSPDGRSLAVSTDLSTAKTGKGTVSLWDVNTGKLLALANDAAGFLGLTFSPDGRA
jgi:WD40 repeat protein